MSARRSRLVPVLLAAVLLVGAANLGAYAATGGPLLLGKSNTAAKTTKLGTTGNGAALKLRSKAGRAPLKVSNSTKIAKLNADLVDGLEGTTLQNRPYVFDLVASSSASMIGFTLPGLPPGRYLVTANVTLNVSGGAATATACSFFNADNSGSLPFDVQFHGVGDGANWVISGSGVLDATVPQRLVCSRSGGASMAIPMSSNYSAQVAFTRLDGVTSVTTLGSSFPRTGRGPAG